jgi:hypothetical protein
MKKAQERTYSPTYEYYNSFTHRQDEPNEDVLSATVMTLWDRLSERTFCMKDDILVLGMDEMVEVEVVRGGRISMRITEPFLADHALYDGRRVVNTIITDGTHQFYASHLQKQRGVPACMRAQDDINIVLDHPKCRQCPH